MASRCANTRRLATSTTPVRYTKPVRHRDVGRVQRPDPVGPVGPGDGQRAQQVGADLVARCALAGSRLRRQRCAAHALHQRGDVAPARLDALSCQLIAQHASAHEGMRQVQLVDAAHERQVAIAGGARPVLHRTSTDVQQLGLARDAQGVFTVDHQLTLRAIPPW